MNDIKALDNLRKLASDFRSDVYKRDEADFVLEIADEIEREINERYIPKPDVPINQKTKLTGINDMHEAARNLMGCASFVVGANRTITVDDFHDALGALVSIADMYYFKLPVDADGAPIHVGDVIAEKPFRPNIGEKPAEVVCMLLNSDGWAIGDCDPRGHWYGPLQLEHVKPDPLKELLNEHLQEREKIVRKLESSMITLGEAESEEDVCDKLFAERIRELMGGDAS